ncbi:MAG: hypothetical protein HZC44_03450 [Geobacter sp.]|nr:hypothetical protein [Geobacter sp.]
MADFRREDFEPHIATVFEVAPVGMDRVPVELVEVKDNGSAALESFSLLFRGRTGPVFRHDTHRMWHPALGEMELFLGPVHIGRTDAIYYQAIFSAPKR